MNEDTPLADALDQQRPADIDQDAADTDPEAAAHRVEPLEPDRADEADLAVDPADLADQRHPVYPAGDDAPR